MTPGANQNEMTEKTLRMLTRIIERTNKYWDDVERKANQTADTDAIKKLEKKQRIMISNKAPMTSSILNGRSSDFRNTKRITIGTSWRGREDRYKIFMPPLHLGDGVIPLVNFQFDYSNESCPTIRVGVEIKSETESSGQMDWMEYRFESPHTCSSKMHHDYFHAQVSAGVGDMHWIDRGTPCLPLPVDNCISLFYCMVACFYGREECAEAFQGTGLNGEYIQFIKQGMKKMVAE